MSTPEDPLAGYSTEQLLTELAQRGATPASTADIPAAAPAPAADVLAVPAPLPPAEAPAETVAAPETPPAPTGEPVAPAVPFGTLTKLPADRQPDAQAQPVVAELPTDEGTVKTDTTTPHIPTGVPCTNCGRIETELTAIEHEGEQLFVHVCKLCGHELDRVDVATVEEALAAVLRNFGARQAAAAAAPGTTEPQASPAAAQTTGAGEVKS